MSSLPWPYPPAPAPATPAVLPRSVVGFWDPFVGIVVVVGMFFGLRHAPLTDAELAAAMVAGLALVLGALELRRAPWRAQARAPEPWTEAWKRALVKVVGAFAALGLAAFVYWLFPEYQRHFYRPYFELVRAAAPFLPLVVVVTLVLTEWRLPRQRDGLWHLGALVLGRRGEVDYDEVKKALLGVLVRVFFLAIMTGDLVEGLITFRDASFAPEQLGAPQLYRRLYDALPTFELVFVVAGYALSCRLFDSHIRDVERSLLGWVAALACYGPFLGLVFTRYLGYRSAITFDRWLEGAPWLAGAWGATIIALLLVHLWCDACFGLRFSNLTNRGVITNGCYRFSKHPAYVAKWLRWLLVHVPFAAGDPADALRATLLFCAVGLLYGVRGYCEERTLSRDPAYVAYGLWMDQHGWLRWVGRLVPGLRYERRLARWRHSETPSLSGHA